jgi:hypothetical protein
MFAFIWCRFSVLLSYLYIQFHHPVCTSSTVYLTVYITNGKMMLLKIVKMPKGGIYRNSSTRL